MARHVSGVPDAWAVALPWSTAPLEAPATMDRRSRRSARIVLVLLALVAQALFPPQLAAGSERPDSLRRSSRVEVTVEGLDRRLRWPAQNSSVMLMMGGRWIGGGQSDSATTFVFAELSEGVYELRASATKRTPVGQQDRYPNFTRMWWGADSLELKLPQQSNGTDVVKVKLHLHWTKGRLQKWTGRSPEL
jgi:hypothetical protein